MKRFAIGTDIGGSHVTSAVIDLQRKVMLEQSLNSQVVDNQAPAEVVLGSWARAIKKSIATIDPKQLAGVGFAMPGPFDYQAGTALFTHAVAKFQSLHGLNVSEQIKKLLDLETDCEVRYINDATAFAIGEAWVGKAAGVKRAMAITLGTGFGSAFLENGIPVVEGVSVPKMGCVWHLPFKDTIADESFCTRWFVKQYSLKSGNKVAGVKELADKAATDPQARDVFVEFGNNLGTFLSPLLKKFRAEALVIGGNVAGAYNLFRESLENALKTQDVSIPIHISVLKENAALIGSARLFDDKFWAHVRPLLESM